MRAAILKGPYSIEVADVETAAPGDGQVLLQVEAVAVCGSDLHSYHGGNSNVRYPTILGHEFSGTVVGLGRGVASELMGMRVCVEPNLSCGSCDSCRSGLPNICADYQVIGDTLDHPGGYAENVVVRASQLHALPPEVTFAEGALVQPLATAYEAVVQRGQVERGDRVLVMGGGPIGLGAMMIARSRGARVAVADVLEYRLDVARRLGADMVVPVGSSAAAAVREWTQGRGVDMAIEAVGGTQGSSINEALRATRPRGRVVIMGSFSDGDVPIAARVVMSRELTVLGSIGHPGTFGPTLEAIATGELAAADLITHRVSLEEISAVFQMVDGRRDGIVKAVVEPQRGNPRTFAVRE